MIHEVAVIVPVADEQETLAGCLRALRIAATRLRAARRDAVTTTVLAVLDGCTDRSADVVARHREVRAVHCDARCVGAARRAGAGRALAARSPEQLESLWLANTDADSWVPADWLVRMLDDADSGADLVLGTVVPDGRMSPPVERAWFDRHDLRDGHPHVHGANLGIRGSAYVALGGWRPLSCGEDDDLIARAAAAGLHMRRTAAVPVHTSTRAYGRAPRGFSSYLRELGHRDAPRSGPSQCVDGGAGGSARR